MEINIGELYAELDKSYAVRDWDRAMSLLADALEVVDRNDSRTCAAIENELAVLYMNMENYVDAEAHALAARNHILKVVGDRDPEYANTLCNLANVYSKDKRYEKSKDLLREAMDIYDDAYGHNSAIYYNTVVRLASDYQGMQEHGMAAYFFKIAADICMTQKQYLNMVTHLYETGMNYMLLGQNQNAIKSLEEAAGVCFEKDLKETQVYQLIVKTLRELRQPCCNPTLGGEEDAKCCNSTSCGEEEKDK